MPSVARTEASSFSSSTPGSTGKAAVRPAATDAASYGETASMLSHNSATDRKLSSGPICMKTW